MKFLKYYNHLLDLFSYLHLEPFGGLEMEKLASLKCLKFSTHSMGIYVAVDLCCISFLYFGRVKRF